MHEVAYPVAAVAGWIALLYKLRDLRRDRDNPVLRALCTALFFPALAFTVATPALYAPIDRAVGFPNLSKLWVHGSLVVFGAAVQRLLLFWAYPPQDARPKVRRRVVTAGAVLATMTVLLVLAPVDRPTGEFAETYATTPYVAEYLLVYLTTVGVSLAEIARLCRRYARISGRAWLRRGLSVTAVGAAVSMGYCVARVVYVLGRNVGVHLDTLSDSASLFAAAGAVIVFVGLTVPAWGTRLDPAVAWVERLRSYRQLQPLWLALYRRAPAIALAPPRSLLLDRWNPVDLRHRLYRRVIEIRDGRLALRSYLDPGVRTRAWQLARESGYDDDAADAVAEAELLRHALRAHADRRPGPGVPTDDGPEGAPGADLAGEIGWLVRVARAYAASPLAAPSPSVAGAPGGPVRGPA